MKKSVLILTTIEGHQSLAQSCESTLEKHKIDFVTFLYPEPILKVYSIIYRFRPQLFRYFFALSNLSLINKLIEPFMVIHHRKRIYDQLVKHQPTIVINTSFAYSPALTQLKKQFDFTFINIVPNTTTFFYQDIAKAADINLVFDEQVKKLASQLKPESKLDVSGWFVRNEFKPAKSKTEVRKKLELDVSLPTFLFTTGSEGLETVIASLKGLVEQKQAPMQLVVACGHNKNLKKKLTELSLNSSEVKLIPISYTNQLFLYMQAADVVIGKAGPNTVFESVAVQVPFIATDHVGGLEDGVVETIKRYEIGSEIREPKELVIELIELAGDSKKLAKFDKPLKKLAEHNQKAGDVLMKYIS